MDQHWPIPGHHSVTVGATRSPCGVAMELGEGGVRYGIVLLPTWKGLNGGY